MTKRENMSNRRGRLGVLLLTAALVCALLSGFAQAAPAEGGSAVLQAAAPKPQITIQGNVVVDKGKPTGFYELALCVRTARTVTDNDGIQTPAQAEEAYAALLAEAAETGDRTQVNEFLKTHTVKNYPFQSAAAAVHINLDALTAVTWGAGKPIYDDWTGSYPSQTNVGYPRGIDQKNPDQPKIFADLGPMFATDPNKKARSVRLDTAKPDEVTNATALIEEAEFDAADPTRRTALLTLSANTTTTPNVVYETPTPVVVVRFAYDMKRFTELEVGDPRDQVNAPNESNFWAGVDVNDRPAAADAARTALTYLGAKDAANPTDPYGVSDAQAAESSVFQSVWVAQNMKSDEVSQETTQFYYYLGAEHCSASGQKNIQVYQEATDTESPELLYVPKTAGSVVLANRDASCATPGDPEAAGGNPNYSFFQNLLRKEDDTLRVELVNAETYRKPTGGGGITILFYDWDDSLIGSLIVDGGDVRSMVEEYVEENLVHPDLRPSDALKAMGGKLPDGGNYTTADQLAYQTLTNSLARDYTYRGKYAYTVGDEDLVGDDGDTEKKARANGEDYPLTNKLDYVFTKRVNTSASYSVDGHTETYVLPHKVTDADMVDAALYPYAYGWAVVEDPSSKNQKNWKVMNDATKLEDTWTTIGVGELSNVEPDYYDGGAADQALPTALGAATYQAPAFLADEDPYWVDHVNEAPQPGMDYTNKYAYSLNSNGSEGYFRFADFSDIDAELARYAKKNGTPKDTLIVKATYEPGERLMDGYNYRLIEKPAYSKFNSQTASDGAAYQVRLTLERSYITENGSVFGVSRIREPMLQMTVTTDYKWLTSDDPEVNHDLDNALYTTAQNKTESVYIKVDVDNGEQVEYDLSLSARMNKVNYVLVEGSGMNFVGGTQRSETNNTQLTNKQEWFIPDNYNYTATDSNEKDDYYDCDYETRDGSYGFVLDCTLGHMMQSATQLRNGEIARSNFESATTHLIAQDANLRVNANMPINGTTANLTALRDGIISAELLCYQHKDDPAYDCWNEVFDCAQLTYHQLVHYLLGDGFMTKEDADKAKLDFCHLHASCAAALSTVPDTWDEIIAAARANNEGDLKKMTPTAIETLTSLRRNANGRQFDTPADFTTAIIDAVRKLDAAKIDPTWGNLQYVIINGAAADETAMKAAGQAAYWWYDGSTSAPTLPSVSSNKEAQWNFLLQAAKDSYAPVPTLKDGVTNHWTSSVRLNLARTPFDRNNTPDQTINRNWINLTHNLVKNATETINTITLDDGSTELEYIYTHEKFPTFEEFSAALVNAVKEAETRDAFPPTWEQVQWYLIKGTWENDPDGFTFSQTEGWWWKDGNVPLRVSSLTTLLQILDMRDNPQTPDDRDNANKALGKVTADFFDNTVYLRLDKDGRKKLAEVAGAQGVDAANAAAWAVEKVNDARKAGATTWNQVQYYIINGKLADTNNEMNRQAGYYWWKNGGEGNDIDFSSATNMQTKLNTLMSATIYTSFGDPKAIESVNNAVGSDVFSFLRLIATTGGKDLLDVKDLETDVKPNAHANADTLLTDVAAFQKVAQTQQGLDEYTRPTAYWHQLQYYVLNKSYIGISDSSYADLQDPEKGYWWYDPTLTARPEPPPPPPERDPQPSDGFTSALKQVLDDGGSLVDWVNDELTVEMLNSWGLTMWDDDGTAEGDLLDRLKWEAGYADVIDSEVQNNFYQGADEDMVISWPTFQYMLLTGAQWWSPDMQPDEKTALEGLINDFGCGLVGSDSDHPIIPAMFETLYPDLF